MKSFKQRLSILIIAVLLLTLGILVGRWWGNNAFTATPLTSNSNSAPDEKKILYWYDPMYPQQHFEQPGKSPFMDMELIPKYAESNDTTNSITINPTVLQNLGIRETTVERIPLTTVIEATGILGFNERDVTIEQSRVSGFVEYVWPLAPGDIVTADQPIVKLSFPEWTAAQQELLAVKNSGDSTLLTAARERLRLLGMPETMILKVERSGQSMPLFIIKSARAGVIQSLDIRDGMTLVAGQTLLRINGIATVWLDVAVPESQANLVEVGDNAEVQMVAFPDHYLKGKVIAILPTLADISRSLRVRIELPNADYKLRPGMAAQVKLLAKNTQNKFALAVPTEAIIRTGKRSLVMLVTGDGEFVPVEVSLGREIGDRTVITSGLTENQRIVLSGQFLLDSEASLRGIIARSPKTSPPENTVPAAELHEADGTIIAIDNDKIKLAHGPFKTLGMPGMTMQFPLATPDLINSIHVGDKVRVWVRETDTGLIIERMKKMGDQP